MSGGAGADGLSIRVDGRAGRITLRRPEALNALPHAMVRAIDAALAGWEHDGAVALVVIDAEGAKAFCAGGDVTDLHAAGRAGDLEFGRRFWRDEYRMNARIAGYRKPVVAFLQGYTMGGGVGLGCHAALRVVGEGSRIAMPEVGIGMLPDVGGTALLARAPGHLGEYLALTAARMGPGDALLAGFADRYLPEAAWPAAIADICASGAAEVASQAAPPAPLDGARAWIDGAFSAPDLAALSGRLAAVPEAEAARAAIARHSPLAMACALAAIRRARDARLSVAQVLELEYRFAHRVTAAGDFLEGVRAAIIDKDRKPAWRHPGPGAVPAAEVAAMLAPLGPDALRLGDPPLEEAQVP